MMTMNDTRTASMLQRVPVILAVTAHSYGLSLQAREGRERPGSGKRLGEHRAMAADGKPEAQR